MKRFGKILTAALALVMVIIMACACGNSGGGDTPAPAGSGAQDGGAVIVQQNGNDAEEINAQIQGGKIEDIRGRTHPD